MQVTICLPAHRRSTSILGVQLYIICTHTLCHLIINCCKDEVHANCMLPTCTEMLSCLFPASCSKCEMKYIYLEAVCVLLVRSLLKPFGDADMSIGITEFGPNWEKVGGTSFVIKHCFFNPHDFAVTARHHVFFQVCVCPLLQLQPTFSCSTSISQSTLDWHLQPVRLYDRGS